MIATSFRILSSILRRHSLPARRAARLPRPLLYSFCPFACGGSRPIKYYQVSYPIKSFVAPDAINTALMVRPFEIVPSLSR